MKTAPDTLLKHTALRVIADKRIQMLILPIKYKLCCYVKI